MKRFYHQVYTRPHDEGGYAVVLDKSAVKTPSGRVLLAPTTAMAEAVAVEWRAQKERIDPDTMPLTQFLNTSIDRVREDRDHFVQATMAYLDTDLLCYRTVLPVSMAARQKQYWDPPLKWFEGHTGKKLATTESLVALEQPHDVRAVVRNAIESLDNDRLTALQIVTVATGSVVLALALVDGAMTASAVFDAAFAEENYKAEVYNEAEHGRAPQQESREVAVRRDLEAAVTFLHLLP